MDSYFSVLHDPRDSSHDWGSILIILEALNLLGLIRTLSQVRRTVTPEHLDLSQLRRPRFDLSWHRGRPSVCLRSVDLNCRVCKLELGRTALSRMHSSREFQQKADLPAVLGQFLANAKLDDLVVELVQNEIDGGSSRTVIRFSDVALVCEGNGQFIDAPGWNRLEMVLGAGGKVPAKKDGIGAKNHGLRTGFWLGDEIQVQSDGKRVRAGWV